MERGSSQSRAYDGDAMMVDAAVVGADELGDRARALLRRGAEFLHAHFAGPGCFAFRIDRAEGCLPMRTAQ